MAVVVISGLFKGYDFQLVQSGLDTSLIEMYALSLNYCLSKFCARGSEVFSERYPLKWCMVLLPASVDSLQRKIPDCHR